MGEIADGILNGDFDEETGEYIGPGQGFPRSFQRERRLKQKKRPGELYGVINFLKNRHITDWQTCIQKYAKEILFPEPYDNNELAVEIQKDFGKFSSWYSKTYSVQNKNPKPVKEDTDQSAADDYLDYLHDQY